MASSQHTTSNLQLSLVFPDPEEWRPISGYEGLYEVSSLGRVRSLTRQVRSKPSHVHGQRKEGRILKPSMDSGQYPSLSLHKEGVQTTHKVHVLVINTFIGSKPTGYVCNHIDADKTNNTVKNLEWVTTQRNSVHALEHGRMAIGEDHPNAKLTETEVESIRYMHRKGMSLQKLAHHFGVHKRTILRIVHRRTWKHVWCP